MSKHPIRKMLGLTLLYSSIIIGIFVLQFRNESVILKNIGLLRMSVAQTQDADGNMSLKNTFSVSFKGISFSADDVNPAKIFMIGSESPKNLILQSWEQNTPLSLKLNFSQGTSLIFSVSDTSSKASLSIFAIMPTNASQVSLNYKPVSGYSVTEQSRTRQLFSSKGISYTMTAAQIQDTQIVFTNSSTTALYTRYDPSKTFNFDSIPQDSETATFAAYEQTVKKYRANLVSQATTAFTDSSALSEVIVAAYVAEMASQSKYAQALETVPESFKKGIRRTYLTSPYFNSLVSMNSTLVMANENFAQMIKNALAQKSLDLFAADNIGDYMLRSSLNPDVHALAALPASLANFEPTLAQATGILSVYIASKKASSQLAIPLENVIEPCLKAITDLCTISSDNLIIHEKDGNASFVQTIETGSVLLDYGNLTFDEKYKRGGYMLINTAFNQNPTFDLRAMAEIYPFMVKSNPAYPHSLPIYSDGNETVWAWTCASNITYEENEDKTEASIVVSFKQGDTQYIILKGIKPFFGIEIYGLSFHTDPRFETYNSSGYAYQEATHTLLLKSRHKVSNEKIRLYFSRKSTQKAEEPKEEPQQTIEQTEDENPE
ncbi:hypothetical protein [Treponema pectinovorum]|uniref:hypothetical protein n=1 Tax=Treponema pectinovorum TaxID=164 RepID=UPI0011CB2A22|nr:hypothetical protein [Treponema pectinovorum]